MYRVTVCRVGHKHRVNRKAKGTFVKEFKTLSDLARFIAKNTGHLYFPNYTKELSRKERFILAVKLNSMVK